METNIPTLYILKRDSFVVKMPKFQLFYALLSKILKKNSVAMVHMTQTSEPAFSVEITRNTSC